MYSSNEENMQKLRRVFLEPKNSTHRQYESLRAHIIDGLTRAEAADKFGYKHGTFRLILHQFRRNPEREFFLPPQKGPREAPKRDRLRERIIELRKKNYSVYDIRTAINNKLSAPSICVLLREEGFARLPRRREDERPNAVRPEAAPVADVRTLALEPRGLGTKFGGLFLFLPYLARIPLDKMLARAGFPGTEMVPAGAAMRSLLALKLFGSARKSHVMSDVFDEGLALFAGLNAIPKRSLQKEPQTEGNSGLSCMGRGWAVFLLRERERAQGRSERRDNRIRQLLEGANRSPPRGADLRFEADHARESR
jgi:hypothetical protein